MKDLKRSATALNWLLNAVFWLCLLRGVWAAGYHSIMIYRLLTDSAAFLTGKMGLTIGWLTLDAAQGFGIDLDTAMAMKLVQLGSAVVITVIACLCIRSLKRILLPIELGEPFRTGAGMELHRLSRLCVYLGTAENLSILFSTILIEKGYGLEQFLVTGPVTDVRIAPQFRPAWFLVAAVVLILSMVFRRGEVLQKLSDETL